MCAKATRNDRKLIINPEFKKHLLLLKRSVSAELDIQISLDKMESDKQYRFMVLSELDGLGSKALNELVSLLKQTPVHIKLTDSEIETLLKPEKKLSSLVLILISLILIVLVASFVSWQNGHHNANTLNEEPSLNDPKATEIPLSKETSETLPVVLPIINKVQLSLPSTERTVKLRLHGSNTVGERLAPALLEAYLRSQSVTKMQWLDDGISVERELQFIQDDQVYAMQLYAHGSSTGFSALLAGEADMSMSSRKIKATEVEALKATMGDLSAFGQEHIIGLDGIAIIVHKNNPVEHISNDNLSKIFSGEISNWAELGGNDVAIKLYARDKNSGTWDTFNSLVLQANNKQLKQGSQRFESSSELSNQVAQDIAAIGFIGLPYVNHAKALAISETQESIATYPTAFTVRTEDYALSRRLYFYAPNSSNLITQKFIEFVLSDEGQQIVENIGLVSQNIKLEEIDSVKNAPKIYNKYAQISSRLSVNFRFESGSNDFDNKAKRDIKRLVEYLTKHSGKRIVLMGFSDSLDDEKLNENLSYMRASKLEKELNAYGLNVTAVEGFGNKLPIASNKTALGRSKNRRVEVWVF